MVSPVQLSGTQKIYFGDSDILNSPGAFQKTSPIPPDTAELSTKSDKKSGSIGKTIAAIVGTVLVLSAAAWGIFKGKGEKWLNPAENAGTIDKIKKYAAKPGEWIDENIVKKVSNKINEWRGRKPESKNPEGEIKPEGEAKPAAETPVEEVSIAETPTAE